MANLANVFVTLKLDKAQFQKDLQAATKSAKSFGKDMKRTGKDLTRSVTLPLAAAGGAALKFSSDFEQSMTELQTLVGLSADRVGVLREEILELGPAVGSTPQELSRAMFAITSGGLRGAEAMEALEQSAKASAIGLGNVTQIGRTATAALQAFGDTGLTAEKAIDTMVATVRAGNLQADELAGSLGQVIGIADAAGVSFEETSSFIATFTRLGTSAEVASTALRATLSSLIKPTTEQREAFQQLGTSVSDFRAEIQEKGLATALVDLIAGAEGNVEVIGRLIPNVRALAGVLGTAGSQSEAFQQVQKDIQDSLGTTNQGFEEIQNTTAQTFNELKAQAASLAIRFGDELAPTFSRVLEVAADLLESFTDMSPEFKRNALLIGGIAAAAGPLLVVFGQLTVTISGLVSVFGSLAGAIAGLQVALGPAGWLVLGASALVGIGVAGWIKSWGDAATRAAGELEDLRTSLEGLNEQAEQMTRQEIARTISSLRLRAETVRREIQSIREELESARDIPTSSGGRLGIGGGAEERRELEARMGALQQQEEELRSTIQGLTEQGRLLGQQSEETADSVSQVGAAAEESASGVDVLSASLSGIDQEFRVIEARARIFGDSFNETAAKADTLKREILSLIRDGFDPQGVVLQDLIDQYEELNAQLIPHTEMVSETSKEYQNLIENQGDAADSNEKLSSEIQSTGQEILAVTSFALNLAESFGLMGEEAGKAGKALQGAIGGAGLGAQVGGPIGAVVGGFLGALGGLLGGGPSPAEKLNQELQVTLRLLGQDAEKLRAAAQALGQDAVSAFKEVVDAQREFTEEFGDALDFSGNVEGITTLGEEMSIDEFNRSMREAGLSLLDLKEAAAELGVPVGELIKVIVTGEGDLNLAKEQLDFFLKAVGMLPDAVDKSVSAIERFNRAMNEIRFEDEIFDLGLMEEFREQLSAVINTFGAQFLGSLSDFDLTTVTGVENAIAELQNIVSQMIDRMSADFPTRGDFPQLGEEGSGSEDAGGFLSPGVLDFFESLSEEEQQAFQDALIDLKGILDEQKRALESQQDVAGGGGTGGGGTDFERDVGPDESFVERSVITEIQGSELIALNRSQLVRLEQTVDRLGSLILVAADLPDNIRDGVDIALSDDFEIQNV